MKFHSQSENENILVLIRTAIRRAKKRKTEIVFSITFPTHINDVLPLLFHADNQNKIRLYWEQPSVGLSFAGLNAVIQLDISESSSVRDISKEIETVMANMVTLNDDDPGIRFIGGHAFNPEGKRDDLIWGHFPRGRFILPECLAILRDGRAQLIISGKVNETDMAEIIHRKFMNICADYEDQLSATFPPSHKVSIEKYRSSPDKNTYMGIVSSALKFIHSGEVEKVVISRYQHIKSNHRLDMSSALKSLRNTYSECTSFFFCFPEEGMFLGATPERLIRKNGLSIHTEALAGTMENDANISEDPMLLKIFLSDPKETGEHQHVVNQICKNLKSITSELTKDMTPHLLKLRNVQHLQTNISGKLKDDKNIMELIQILHPTPAVAGTPTRKALDIILKLELQDRGWYSGPLGWLDRYGNGEFVVGLRSALVIEEEVFIFAGSGIVLGSHPEKEWEETEWKLQPILNALSGK